MSKTETITGKIEDKDIIITTAEIERDKDAGSGWINLRVTVVESGNCFHVGGASFDIGGRYEPYTIGGVEVGDIEGLTEDLGYDPEDDDTLESVLADLHCEASDLLWEAAHDIECIAPSCSHDDDHEWELDPDDSFKGVRGEGGAAISITHYCLHCGCKRVRISGDTNRPGNRNGVSYEEEALTEEELKKMRAAYGYEDEDDEDDEVNGDDEKVEGDEVEK